MSSVLVMVLVFGAPPSEGLAASVNHPAAVSSAAKQMPMRSGRELDRAVHEALRRWARPKDNEVDKAAREFLTLYGELVRDDKLAATSDPLRNKVRGRLMQESEQISKRIAREKRLAKSEAPKKLESPAEKQGELAQWGMRPAVPGGMAGPGFGPQPMAGGMPGVGAGGQGRAELDNGQALVDLIQATIAPSTWEANGGPGSIYYWQSLRVLVIRQTDEVHGSISDTLEQLERAGR